MPEAWTPPNAEYPPPKPGEPALFRAARTGDAASLRRLASAGADLEAEFNITLDPGAHECPATPLMVAAGSGDGADEATVRLLIELGADPRRTTAAGTPADFACAGLGWNYRPGGDTQRLRALLDAGSPLTVDGRRGARLVADTAARGDADRLSLVLAAGGPSNPVFGPEDAAERRRQLLAMHALPHPGFTPPPGLEELMARSMKEVTERIIQRSTAGPYSFEIPLFMAAESGSAGCVRALIAGGAVVTQRDNDGATALFQAGSAEVVAALVGAGVDPLAVDDRGRDALDEALGRTSGERTDAARSVCRALVSAGVPLARRPRAGRDRLADAAFELNAPAVEFLLEEGHPATASGWTPLHAVCFYWDHGDERDEATRRIIQALVGGGCPVMARDDRGDTPLHTAITGDGANLVAAEALLRAGADVNAVNNDGATPLLAYYERLFTYEQVVPFLLAHGADPLITNKRGRTVIDVARRMLRGENPEWRVERFKGAGEPPCGWKEAATPGDAEHRMLELLEAAARRGPQ